VPAQNGWEEGPAHLQHQVARPKILAASFCNLQLERANFQIWWAFNL